MSIVPDFPPSHELDAHLQRARQLKSIILSPVSTSDVELLSVDALAPLTGFLTRADYERVVGEMRLAGGGVWSIPITLPVTREQAGDIREGEQVALAEASGRILATMTVQEKFGYDKQREAREVYRTEDEKHPGVARVYQQGDVYLGGPITPLQFPPVLWARTVLRRVNVPPTLPRPPPFPGAVLPERVLLVTISFPVL